MISFGFLNGGRRSYIWEWCGINFSGDIYLFPPFLVSIA